MRKTRRQKDGCSSQRVSLHGLLYIHTPSSWCTLQCIFSCKRREIVSLSPNTLSFLIFQESICAKLGGTMKVLEIKWFNFINFTTPSMTKMSYLQKLVSKSFLVKSGHWLRGRMISNNSFKISSSHTLNHKQKCILWSVMCQSELILKSFFIKYKNLLQNSSYWAHNDLPHELRGSGKRIPFYQKTSKISHISLPKAF